MNKQYLSEARLRYLAGTITESEYLAMDRVSMVKQIKETLNSFTKREFPKALKKLENNLIEHIDTNEFFTLAERNAVKLFFKHYSVLNESNIKLFSANILQEGFFDTIKSIGSSVVKGIKGAWQKIKTIIGNVGKWLSKVWQSIKNTLIGRFATKVYKMVSDLLGSKEAKAAADEALDEYLKGTVGKVEIEKVKPLEKEGFHMRECVKWGKKGVENWFDSKDVASKAPDMNTIEDKISDLEESFFTSDVSKFLFEAEMTELPTDIFAPGAEAQWKKLGEKTLKILGYILKGLAWITNPIYKLVMTIVTGSAKIFLNGASKLIAFIKGPPAIVYTILPIIIAETAELKHAFDSVTDFIDTATSFIGWAEYVGPGVVTVLKTLISFTSIVFSALAYFEIFEKILEGRGILKPH